MRSQNGFTLIEVLITVAAIAILAAVALPSYSAYVMRANVTDATRGLADMRLKMGQYFQDRRTYVGACSAGTVAPLPAPTDKFTFRCDPAPSVGTYTVVATGINRMAGFVFTVDQLNAQTTTAPPSSGWQSCATKWMAKPSDTCP